MATVVPVITQFGNRAGGGIGGYVIAWPAMSAGDDGGYADANSLDVKDVLGNSNISIQVEGTFSGTATIQGCNELTPTNWRTLNDPQGNALDFTAAKIEQLLESPLRIRPINTSATSVLVTAVVRRKG